MKVFVVSFVFLAISGFSNSSFAQENAVNGDCTAAEISAAYRAYAEGYGKAAEVVQLSAINYGIVSNALANPKTVSVKPENLAQMDKTVYDGANGVNATVMKIMTDAKVQKVNKCLLGQ